jgi:hypothetical protein
METGKRNLIPLNFEKFEKLGLFRFALKLPETRAENVTAAATAEQFYETKAVKATLEVKRAEAMCQARRILNIPR